MAMQSASREDKNNVEDSNSGNDDSHKKHGGNGPSKLGRRGDPRMHKAVRARLENPDLSLLEALRLGGFDFPSDCSKADDSLITDSDNITLGQRKNQLSRRCRLARQGKTGGLLRHESPVSSPGSASQPTTNAGLTGELSTEAQNRIQELMNQSQPASMGQSSEAGRKRPASLLGEAVSPQAAEPNDDVDMEDDIATMQRRMAKFHPQYQPLLIPPAHPHHHLGIVPATAPTGAATLWPGTTSLPNHTTNSVTNSNTDPSAQVAAAANSAAVLANVPATPHHASGVAVTSLSRTASAVGMTLEQLALTLSSSPNLMKALIDPSSCQPQSGKDSSASEATKQSLALNLYDSERRALQQRCMLLAGYNNQEVQETSPAYWQFLLQAWNAQGKQLQLHMGTRTTGPSPETTGDDDELLDAPTQVTTAAQAAANNSKTACFDGRHLHELEGKCGHIPILHRPPDGPVHVDFLVGNEIECYQGIAPVGSKAVVWPSRYKCAQLHCASEGSQKHRVTCGPEACEQECIPAKETPKTLQVSDITFDGNEWNFDVADEGLLGMVRLGGGDTETFGGSNSVSS